MKQGRRRRNPTLEVALHRVEEAGHWPVPAAQNCTPPWALQAPCGGRAVSGTVQGGSTRQAAPSHVTVALWM